MRITAPFQQLTINDIRLPVILGWWAEEQVSPQEIRLDIVMRFENNKAVLSDDLANTVCYATLVAQLKELLSSRSFKLIEHCCFACYECIKNTVASPISITLTKLKIPVDSIRGGTSYTCSDFKE